MKRILPTVIPPIKAFPDYACPLTIILSHENTLEWFYCNYIHLYFIINQRVDPMGFYIPDYKGNLFNTFIPWIDYQILNRDLIFNLNINIIDILKYSLDNEQYIVLYWDEFYIPNGICVEEKPHYWHKTFIYGYDDLSENFYTYGYKGNGQYESCLICYKDFHSSFYSNKGEMKEVHKKIYFLKFDTEREYKFDLKCVIDHLNDYLYSVDVTRRFNNSFNPLKGIKFGFSVYDCLKDYYDKPYIVKDIASSSYHIALCILYEHKKVMLSRIRFLQDEKHLDDFNKLIQDYEVVVNNSCMLKNLFIKYTILGDETITKKIVFEINKIANLEKKVLEGLIKKISK